MLRAADLAERFNVTTRTIERDLHALQEAGVPIWAQPGPGGGYGIIAETTLPPLNLTPAEAAAIATALAVTQAMPFAEAGRSALAKLTGVMAAAPRDAASKLVSHIRVARGPGGPGGSVPDVIQKSLIDASAIALTYRDGQGRETQRVVEPIGVFGTHNGWFLAAWCRLRGAPRVFRLDRITRATLTDEPITPRPLESVLPPLPYDVTEPVLR